MISEYWRFRKELKGGERDVMSSKCPLHNYLKKTLAIWLSSRLQFRLSLWSTVCDMHPGDMTFFKSSVMWTFDVIRHFLKHNNHY